MNLAEHTKGGRELFPGQFFELAIPVGRPGPLALLASVRRRSLTLSAPVHYLLELFAPGSSQPVTSREVEGNGLLGILEFFTRGNAGVWTARITNINSHPLHVSLSVSYPGLADAHPRAIPAHFLEAIASRLLAETSIEFQHGCNACSVRFAPALGLRDFRFSVPALERTVSPPFLPDIPITEQVNRIASNSLRMGLLPGSVANPGGTLRLEIGFEEDGLELIGSFPIHLARMKLLIELDLGVAYNRISHNNVRTTFDFDVDIQALPVWMYNPLFDFRDRLQEAVCAGVRAAFADVDTCEAIAAGLERGLETVLGAGVRTAAVEVENGQVRLGLHPAAAFAAA